VITRRHFNGYRPVQGAAPPPLHVESANPDANWHPLGRPLEAGGHVGPALILGGPAFDSLGLDPTDRATWGGRGYRPCAGMVGRLNDPDDWRGA
jgi:hypothetical protein